MFNSLFRVRFVFFAALTALAGGTFVLMADEVADKPAADDMKTVAAVNGEEIGREELVRRLLERYGGAELQQMIIESLVNQDAKKNGVAASKEEIEEALNRAVDDEIDAQKADFLKQSRGLMKWEDYLAQMNTTEEEMRKPIREEMLKRDREEGVLAKNVVLSKLTWYDMLTRDRVDVEQIMVETEAEAKEALKSLNDGKDFSELARDKVPSPQERTMRELSLGDYRVRPDVPGPEFERAALSLKEGEVSAPVKSSRGWHVIKALKREDRKSGTYAELADEVKKYMGDPRTSNYSSLYIWRLLVDCKIENTSGLKVPVLDMLEEREKEAAAENPDKVPEKEKPGDGQ